MALCCFEPDVPAGTKETSEMEKDTTFALVATALALGFCAIPTGGTVDFSSSPGMTLGQTRNYMQSQGWELKEEFDTKLVKVSAQVPGKSRRQPNIVFSLPLTPTQAKQANFPVRRVALFQTNQDGFVSRFILVENGLLTSCPTQSGLACVASPIHKIDGYLQPEQLQVLPKGTSFRAVSYLDPLVDKPLAKQAKPAAPQQKL